MIQIPLQKIIDKIKEEKGISEEEINSKIKEKLEMLSGLISKEGAAHIIAKELGVTLVQSSEDGPMKIPGILAGMRNIEVIGRVMRKFDVREFNTAQGGTGKVGSFFLSDSENQIRIVLWHDNTDILEKMQENDIIKVISGYSKENNGVVEIHTNNYSKIEINPKGVKTPKLEITGGAAQMGGPIERKKISDLDDNLVNSSAELFGTVVQVYDIKFFEVCPKCRKRVREQGDEGFKCPMHDIVEPDYNYVLTLFFDDGTGNIRTVFFGEQVEKLLGISQDDVLKYTKEVDKFEDVKTDLLGKILKIQGRVVKNAMFDRMEIMVNMVDSNPSPEDEVNQLEKEKPVLSDEVIEEKIE